jgi:hypothetical protein
VEYVRAALAAPTQIKTRLILAFLAVKDAANLLGPRKSNQSLPITGSVMPNQVGGINPL